MDPLQRLQDNVNYRMQWKKCTFSGNGNNRFNISLSLSLFLSLCLSLSVYLSLSPCFASFIIMFVNILYFFSPLSLLSLLLLFSHFFFPPLSLSSPLGDGDYICAGSHRQHELYIWDKATGNLVKILTGPKGESLLDLTWHPVKPVILSVSNGLLNLMVTCSG